MSGKFVIEPAKSGRAGCKVRGEKGGLERVVPGAVRCKEKEVLGEERGERGERGERDERGERGERDERTRRRERERARNEGLTPVSS